MKIGLQIGTIDNGKLKTELINQWDTEILEQIINNQSRVFFRIPCEEDIIEWDTFVDDNWSSMDDYYFYGFEIPSVSTTNWYCYCNGYLYELKSFIKTFSNILANAKDFSSKVAYMN